MASGSNANASGAGSTNVAIGSSANASGVGVSNTAVGGNAVATGANSAAFGSSASATFDNSAAFGNGATATRANQQMFGTASNTYIMAGITSAASAAAQRGPVQIVTSDAGGNLATASAASLGLVNSSQITAINGELANLSSQIGQVRRGVAATAAIAYAATPSAPGRTTFALNGSVYDTAAGFGISFVHRMAGTSVPVYFSGSYGNGGGREQVGRVGFAWEW
jgi:trimeric autotransporter adhesin